MARQLAESLVASIGGRPMPEIRCPNCDQTYPAWFQGLIWNNNEQRMERLSGYRLLSSHLEEECEGSDNDDSSGTTDPYAAE